jgi:hypothetical protein
MLNLRVSVRETPTANHIGRRATRISSSIFSLEICSGWKTLMIYIRMLMSSFSFQSIGHTAAFQRLRATSPAIFLQITLMVATLDR